jgi:hypothetical protein
MGIAALLWSCATAEKGVATYVGNWEYEDATGYTGIALHDDDRCMIFGVEKNGAAIGAAIGTLCRFVRDANKVTIVEYSDESTTNKADPPIELKYIPTRDVLEMDYEGKPISLSRTRKFKYFPDYKHDG